MMCFLSSGMMFIVFTWRAKDGRLSTLHYRLVLAAVPLLVLTVIMSLFAWYMIFEYEPPPPPPTVAEMLEDRTLLDCDILRPAAEDARYELMGAQFGGATKHEIEYWAMVQAVYIQNC